MPTYPAGLSGGRVEPWAPVQTKPGMGPQGPSEGKKGSLGRERWCAADRQEDMVKDMVSPLSDSAVASKKKAKNNQERPSLCQALTDREAAGDVQGIGPSCLSRRGRFERRAPPLSYEGRPWAPRPSRDNHGALGCFSPSLPFKLKLLFGRAWPNETGHLPTNGTGFSRQRLRWLLRKPPSQGFGVQSQHHHQAKHRHGRRTARPICTGAWLAVHTHTAQ